MTSKWYGNQPDITAPPHNFFLRWTHTVFVCLNQYFLASTIVVNDYTIVILQGLRVAQAAVTERWP